MILEKYIFHAAFPLTFALCRKLYCEVVKSCASLWENRMASSCMEPEILSRLCHCCFYTGEFKMGNKGWDRINLQKSSLFWIRNLTLCSSAMWFRGLLSSTCEVLSSFYNYRWTSSESHFVLFLLSQSDWCRFDQFDYVFHLSVLTISATVTCSLNDRISFIFLGKSSQFDLLEEINFESWNQSPMDVNARFFMMITHLQDEHWSIAVMMKDFLLLIESADICWCLLVNSFNYIIYFF